MDFMYSLHPLNCVEMSRMADGEGTEDALVGLGSLTGCNIGCRRFSSELGRY